MSEALVTDWGKKGGRERTVSPDWLIWFDLGSAAAFDDAKTVFGRPKEEGTHTIEDQLEKSAVRPMEVEDNTVSQSVSSVSVSAQNSWKPRRKEEDAPTDVADQIKKCRAS